MIGFNGAAHRALALNLIEIIQVKSRRDIYMAPELKTMLPVMGLTTRRPATHVTFALLGLSHARTEQVSGNTWPELSMNV
jgi:hypothetical protein